MLDQAIGIFHRNDRGDKIFKKCPVSETGWDYGDAPMVEGLSRDDGEHAKVV